MMPPEYLGPERRSAPRAGDDDHVVQLQRDANEKLVLTAIRAQEESDVALAARRRAEEEAREVRVREEELRITAEFRERLIGIIGHDLRNPLHTITMASALQISRGNLTPEDAKLATRILNSGHRMERMIRQLCDFTRARLAGGFDLKLEMCDIGNVCKDIAEELRLSSVTEIVQTIEGDLRGIWDADRIAQVISNIAGNAVEHATPGTPIVIHALGEIGNVVVAITNQGPCIAPELLPVIFKAFRRMATDTRPNADHLGLGLYVASELVHSHGGMLTVTSSEGRTTFTMRLPREHSTPS